MGQRQLEWRKSVRRLWRRFSKGVSDGESTPVSLPYGPGSCEITFSFAIVFFTRKAERIHKLFSRILFVSVSGWGDDVKLDYVYLYFCTSWIQTNTSHSTEVRCQISTYNLIEIKPEDEMGKKRKRWPRMSWDVRLKRWDRRVRRAWPGRDGVHATDDSSAPSSPTTCFRYKIQSIAYEIALDLKQGAENFCVVSKTTLSRKVRSTVSSRLPPHHHHPASSPPTIS